MTYAPYEISDHDYQESPTPQSPAVAPNPSNPPNAPAQSNPPCQQKGLSIGDILAIVFGLLLLASLIWIVYNEFQRSKHECCKGLCVDAMNITDRAKFVQNLLDKTAKQ